MVYALVILLICENLSLRAWQMSLYTCSTEFIALMLTTLFCERWWSTTGMLVSTNVPRKSVCIYIQHTEAFLDRVNIVVSSATSLAPLKKPLQHDFFRAFQEQHELRRAHALFELVRLV